MGEFDRLNNVNERLRVETERMRKINEEEEKRVSEKAERDNQKSTAVKKEDSVSTWKEIGWRVVGISVISIATSIMYPDVPTFERMVYVMIWLIWMELFAINTRRR